MNRSNSTAKDAVGRLAAGALVRKIEASEDYVLLQQGCCPVSQLREFQLRIKRGRRPQRGYVVRTCPRCGRLAAFVSTNRDVWLWVGTWRRRSDACLLAWAVQEHLAEGGSTAAVARWLVAQPQAQVLDGRAAVKHMRTFLEAQEVTREP